MTKKKQASLVLSFAMHLQRYSDHTCVYYGCEAMEDDENMYGGHQPGCPPRAAMELADELMKEWETEQKK